MKKIILYSACSLDNFIARKNGAVDWLFQDGDYGYYQFYDSIDTTIMGNATYQQVLTFGDFPYKNKQNFVLTHNTKKAPNEHVTFLSHNVLDFIKKLRMQKGKDIWLIGGGQINSILLEAGLVDEMILSIHPVILGEGISLFEGTVKQADFELIDCKKFKSGLVQLFFKRKNI